MSNREPLPTKHYAKIGAMSTPAKRRAAKLNGKKGGRPRKAKK